MRTLQQRGFIAEVGKDPGPGQATLFGTTPLFLERIGLNGLEELPQLSDFVPGADIVEHLEAGLRPPPGPSLGERLDEIEEANAARAEHGRPLEIHLDPSIDLDDLDDLDD
jgi:segregation and condensation protein B